MASISGRRINRLAIGTGTLSNTLVSVEREVVETLTWNEGTALEQWTAAGDAVANYDEIKDDPSLVIAFKTDPADATAWSTVFFSTKGDRIFELEVLDGREANSGLSLSGVCKIDGPVTEWVAATGRVTTRCTLRPVGVEWVKSQTVS